MMRRSVSLAAMAVFIGAALSAHAGAPGGDLTIVMVWKTAGTDMDLHVVEPSGERCWSSHSQTRSGGQLLNDCLRGPGQETYVNPQPVPGNYKIEVVNYQGGPPTEVTVRVLRGGQLVGTHKATLTRRGQRVLVHTVGVGQVAAPPVQAGALTVVARWETVGTDIDLHVVEPTGERCWANNLKTRTGGRLLKDVRKGPGEETYVAQRPVQGDYRVELINYEGGPPTPVAVEIRRGGRLIAAHKTTLTLRRERVHVHTVRIERGPPAPDTAATTGTGPLVVQMSWPTQGTDVDLIVVDPQRKTRPVLKDILKGPGQEVCVVRRPAPGRYHIAVRYYNSAGGQTTPVTVAVRRGKQVVGTYKATLSRAGETRIVQSVVLRAAPPGRNDYVVVTKWGTRGTDVDTRVIEPDGQITSPLKDCEAGPGQETCIIRSPAPGDYKLQALYFNNAGGQQTPISVQVLRENRLVGASKAVLSRPGETQFIYTLRVPGVRPDDAKADLYVLSVGVADYPGKSKDLLWCARDAERLAACLKKQEGRLYRRVHVLPLLDAQATRGKISNARRTFLARTRPQDVVLIFLSGHGGGGSFCAYDGPYSFRNVRRELMGGLAARKLVLMLDACHAGEVGSPIPGVPSARVGGERVDLIKGPNLKRMHQELANATGCYLFMSSEADQTSQEFVPQNPMRPQVKGDRELLRKLACFPIGDRDDLYDVFAFAVIDGLRGGAADPDGVVTVTGLMAHVDRVCRLVRKHTAHRWFRPVRQRPCVAVPTNSRDFPLAVYPHLRRTRAQPPRRW